MKELMKGKMKEYERNDNGRLVGCGHRACDGGVYVGTIKKQVI